MKKEKYQNFFRYFSLLNTQEFLGFEEDAKKEILEKRKFSKKLLSEVTKEIEEYKSICFHFQNVSIVDSDEIHQESIKKEKIYSKTLDNLVRSLSRSFLTLINDDIICFYDLPLKITCCHYTDKSKQWIKDFGSSTDDHWIIHHKKNLFIAWRQETGYFFNSYYDDFGGYSKEDGFLKTLKQLDIVFNAFSQKISSIHWKISPRAEKKFSDIKIIFQK